METTSSLLRYKMCFFWWLLLLYEVSVQLSASAAATYTPGEWAAVALSPWRTSYAHQRTEQVVRRLHLLGSLQAPGLRGNLCPDTEAAPSPSRQICSTPWLDVFKEEPSELSSLWVSVWFIVRPWDNFLLGSFAQQHVGCFGRVGSLHIQESLAAAFGKRLPENVMAKTDFNRKAEKLAYLSS